MEFFKRKTHIDFLNLRKLAIVLSAALIAVSIISLSTRGLNFGIDFTGGTLVEVGYPQSVKLDGIREVLTSSGFANSTVQRFGTTHDVLIRLPLDQNTAHVSLSDQILQALRQHDKQVELRRVEFVGPQVGDDLREDGGLAMLFALIGILIYVALRFEFRFSIGSVIALIHDVIITVGFFSVTQISFDLNVLAAILAVIGYSLNDTIVVFDRIRENFRKLRKDSVIEIMNLSVNETLSRTIMTALTTLLVLIGLAVLGGEVMFGFAMALIVGILIGTYSSIYVASAAAFMLGVSRADLAVIKKEGADLDQHP